MSEIYNGIEVLQKERNIEFLISQFIDKAVIECPYATKDQIIEVVREAADIIRRFPDSKPEEWIEELIQPNILKLEEIRRIKPVPGYTSGVNIGNINVQMYGGNIDGKGMHYDVEKGIYICDDNAWIGPNALFDVASQTKLFTEIVAYNLIAERVFSFDSIVSELDDRFSKLGDLTIGEILSFCTAFKTPGRLDDVASEGEALERLYGTEVTNRGNYNYNDIGMIIMKQVMEKVTGKTYEELVDKYIISKLNLKDTYLTVPTPEINRVTGSANSKLGKCNDPKAIVLGGFSGHAGIFMTQQDAAKIAYGIDKLIPSDMISDAYTQGGKLNRGIMGNTYISLPGGTKDTFVSIYEPKNTFAYQGSGRTNSSIWVSDDPIFRGGANIFFNPGSMDINWAYVLEKDINYNKKIKALETGKTYGAVSLYKFYEINGEKYRLIDARNMLPADESVEPTIDNNAKLGLKLGFIRLYLDNLDKDYKTTYRKTHHVGGSYKIGISPLETSSGRR